MINMAQATDELICEECGLRRQEWKGNNGRGVSARGVLACCVGCSEGLGCSCKETGVRRVVVVNQEDNKKQYVGKMDRQMKEWQKRIEQLESRARNRNAEQNAVVKKELNDLRKRLNESRGRLTQVASAKNDWGQKARAASSGYRRLKATVEDLGNRVKEK
jgi:TolA-binding protein